MIGDHGFSFIADACVKGVQGTYAGGALGHLNFASVMVGFEFEQVTYRCAKAVLSSSLLMLATPVVADLVAVAHCFAQLLRVGRRGLDTPTPTCWVTATNNTHVTTLCAPKQA